MEGGGGGGGGGRCCFVIKDCCVIKDRKPKPDPFSPFDHLSEPREGEGGGGLLFISSSNFEVNLKTGGFHFLLHLIFQTESRVQRGRVLLQEEDQEAEEEQEVKRRL